jgi:hypothetical protein
LAEKIGSKIYLSRMSCVRRGITDEGLKIKLVEKAMSKVLIQLTVDAEKSIDLLTFLLNFCVESLTVKN